MPTGDPMDPRMMMDHQANRNRKNILTLHGNGLTTAGMQLRQQQQQQQQQHQHQQRQHPPPTHAHSHHAQRHTGGHRAHTTGQLQPQLAQPQHPPQDGHIEGLPKSFVAAMRTLFDIMDDRETGFVRLADIEDRWQDDGVKSLPRGVIDSLRKVTPPNGLLSFERFCGGLKICLLRNQGPGAGVNLHPGHPAQPPSSSSSSSPPPPPPLLPSLSVSEKTGLPTAQALKLSVRPPSAPLLDLDGGGGGISVKQSTTSWSTMGSGGGSSNTATVRPNNAMPAQKTLSMPQLNPDNDLDLEPPPIILPGAFGPPKPPRVSLNLVERSAPQSGSNIDKAEIRNALQNWQMSLLMSESDKADKSQLRLARGSADGQTDLSNSSPSLQSMHQERIGIYQKKGGNGRRREPRRHTLQNGVDYNMLKRLKQIEQEKDILVQGLTAVEKAKDWYLRQLSTVQEKIRYLGRPGSHMETWTETHQERLDLQRARVLEVNRHLVMLAESWERGGFPMHMNLALRSPGGPLPYQQQQQQQQQHLQQRHQQTSVGNGQPQQAAPQAAPGSYQQQQPELVNRLKQQNHQLSEEINQKNDKLSLLEREKAALIRELLQLQRAGRGNGSMISNTEEMVF